MDINNILVLCVIVVFQFALGQIISELKCEEAATLFTSAQSSHPHLMEIFVIPTDNELSPRCMGTLISNDYLLTSLTCMQFNDVKLNDLRVRKALVDGDEYLESSDFTIKRFIWYDDVDVDIGLIQLNEMIRYQDGVSIFRPACLWTENSIPLSVRCSIYGRRADRNDVLWNSSLQIIPGAILTDGECGRVAVDLLGRTIEPYQMCVNTSAPPIFHAWGSPIEANVFNRNYIFGIFSSYITGPQFTLSLGTKVGRLISWIESNVWPASNNANVMREFRCGERKIKHKSLIAFGLPTYHGEYPWHVALYQLGGDFKTERYICGGTIIDKRTILTAAHCVNNERGTPSPNRLIVVAGTNNLNERTIDAQSYGVETVVVHEEYDRHYLENDIALLKLNRSIAFTNYIQPICIRNTTEFSNSVVGTVAGWGRDEYNEQSDILLQATLPIRSNTECRRSNREFFQTYLNDFNYCAGYQNGTNVCSGDSGGGMIFEHKSQWYIHGIVSLGVALPNSDLCDITQMVLFTDATKFYNWIVSHLE